MSAPSTCSPGSLPVYRRGASRAATTLLGLLLASAALAETRTIVSGRLQQQDLVLDVRQVRDDGSADSGATTWSSSTQPDPGVMAQSVRVRNGEKAALQWQTSQPMQWMQSLQFQSAALSAASASASAAGAGMSQALVWMESGQSWTVTPRWAGGTRPVRLELELKAQRVEDRTGADLPPTQRQQLTTTVSAPLGQWVTLAASGQALPRGTYSSQPHNTTRTLLQVRVTRP